MDDQSVRDYGMTLYERRLEARPVVRYVVDSAQPNSCHDNVTRFCNGDPRYTPVRGWLYVGCNSEKGFARFRAHSLLRTPKGELADITPYTHEGDYSPPFLEAQLEWSDFVALTHYLEDGTIDYYY